MRPTPQPPEVLKPVRGAPVAPRRDRGPSLLAILGFVTVVSGLVVGALALYVAYALATGSRP